MKEDGVTILEKALTKLSMISLMLMMFTVFIDVSGRFFINKPIAGAKEIIEFTMIFLVYFGLSYTQSQNGHVGMDLFVDKLKNYKGKVRLLILTINSLVSISVSALLIVFAFGQTLSVYNRGVLSIYLQWPMWIMSLCMLLGVTLLFLRVTKEFLDSIKENTQREAQCPQQH
ncbi:TRAP transporter small permease [Oceanisphaera sp.]|uniref:TRAP transporter small permease n=1 Tax=Oceanisphaera sp. TaxID=1929979 RepID=UPI003A8E7514